MQHSPTRPSQVRETLLATAAAQIQPTYPWRSLRHPLAPIQVSETQTEVPKIASSAQALRR